MTTVLVNLDVDDLEKAIAFYHRGLGLELKRRLFDGTVAEMAGASSPILLLAKPAGSPASITGSLPRDYRRHWTPLHLDFIVEDVEVAAQKAVAAGATLEGTVQSYRWGRLATLSDPFGHGFCLLQFIGRGYDEVSEPR